jgi:signal transduction histidine kinase
MINDAAEPSACPAQAESPILIEQERIAAVERRIRQKIEDYERYDFNVRQSISLNVFFDLAQEFSSLEDLYAIFLLIPKIFFERECELYVLDEDSRAIRRCAFKCPVDAPLDCFPASPEERDGHYLIPIKGNGDLISQLPFAPLGNTIGLLRLADAPSLSGHDKLFFERYANRFGYQLHNRIISKKNAEHIQFIRSLVKDIGHNVIVPNIYFKLFYKRLNSSIDMLEAFKGKLENAAQSCGEAGPQIAPGLTEELDYIHQGLKNQYHDIYSHYSQTSLFLETLLRRSHFEKGRYVLEKRRCNFKKQIIDPQVERYRGRLEERGIEIDTSLGGVPDEEVEVVADVGLITQVYSNFFSNAVKYAREITDNEKRRRKFLAYGWRREKDAFGPGRDGIKLNVFTSGQPLTKETCALIFEEGTRGENASDEYGTGHGLYFVREIVSLHGGRAGCEPAPYGNNFFFILPLEHASASEPGPPR